MAANFHSTTNSHSTTRWCRVAGRVNSEGKNTNRRWILTFTQTGLQTMDTNIHSTGVCPQELEAVSPVGHRQVLSSKKEDFQEVILDITRNKDVHAALEDYVEAQVREGGGREREREREW